MKTGIFNWRVNHQIRAGQVRMIGADTKQIGIVTISEALAEAQKAGLDLVEVAPNAKPPVVRIVELGKFKYQEEKKLQKEKKKAKAGELKEVRLSPFIAEHDYTTRMERVREFMEENNKVRVVVVFMGRQMDSRKFGYDLLKRVTEELGDKIVIDADPKFFGRHLSMIISPVKKGSKA